MVAEWHQERNAAQHADEFFHHSPTRYFAPDVFVNGFVHRHVEACCQNGIDNEANPQRNSSVHAKSKHGGPQHCADTERNNDDFSRFIILIWQLYAGFEILNKDFVTTAFSYVQDDGII